MPGKLKFDDLGHLCRGASAFVFPSLYEGFGISALRSHGSQSARNFSLGIQACREVGGEVLIFLTL